MINFKSSIRQRRSIWVLDLLCFVSVLCCIIYDLLYEISTWNLTAGIKFLSDFRVTDEMVDQDAPPPEQGVIHVEINQNGKNFRCRFFCFVSVLFELDAIHRFMVFSLGSSCWSPNPVKSSLSVGLCFVHHNKRTVLFDNK